LRIPKEIVTQSKVRQEKLTLAHRPAGVPSAIQMPRFNFMATDLKHFDSRINPEPLMDLGLFLLNAIKTSAVPVAKSRIICPSEPGRIASKHCANGYPAPK